MISFNIALFYYSPCRYFLLDIELSPDGVSQLRNELRMDSDLIRPRLVKIQSRYDSQPYKHSELECWKSYKKPWSRNTVFIMEYSVTKIKLIYIYIYKLKSASCVVHSWHNALVGSEEVSFVSKVKEQVAQNTVLMMMRWWRFWWWLWWWWCLWWRGWLL